MFSMTLETKQVNSLDGKIKTKRENIRVKVIDTCFYRPVRYICDDEDDLLLSAPPTMLEPST